MQNSEIQAAFTAMAEPEFQAFTARLLPGVAHIRGVRLPKLRKLARRIVKADWEAYLKHASDGTYEEIMLQGMVIGYAPCGLERRLQYIDWFLNKIDNWSVCDSFCAGLKAAKESPDVFWAFLQPYLADSREFAVRFAVVMLLFYFIDAPYLDRVLEALDSVRHTGYYAQMAVAWAVSICYVHFPARTLRYLQGVHRLDSFTYHKALQKIIESKQITPAQREEIRRMKQEKLR